MLENIRRSNIKHERYDDLRIKAEKKGIQTDCELIYGLPGESYESFLQGMVGVTRSGQFVQLYEHTILLGAESANREYREKYGIKSAFRYAYDIEGTYKDISSIEFEEVVIETKTMPQKDYFRLRQLHFLIATFSARLFQEFRHALKYNGLEIATLAGKIMEDEANWPERWRDILLQLQQACRDELLTTDVDELRTEFSKEDLSEVRKKARALIPSSMCTLFAREGNMRELRGYLVSSFPRFFPGNSDEDFEDWTAALDFSMDRACCYDELKQTRVVTYPYDLDAWLGSEGQPLRDYALPEPATYSIELRDGVWEAFEKAKEAGSDLENAVYLLKMKYFPSSHDRIYYYLRPSKGGTAVNNDDEIESKREARLPLYSSWNTGGEAKPESV